MNKVCQQIVSHLSAALAVLTGGFDLRPSLADELVVGVPYLPAPIDAFSPEEPLNALMIQNIAPSLFETAVASVSSEQHGRRFRLTFRTPNRTRPVRAEDLAGWIQIAKSHRAGLLAPGEKEVAWPFLDAIHRVDVVRTLGKTRQLSDSLVINLSANRRQFIPEFKRFPFVFPEFAEAFPRNLGQNTLIDGTGYYLLKHADAGQIELVAASVDAQQQGQFDRILFRRIESTARAIKALRSGEIEMLFLPTPAMLQIVLTDPTLSIEVSPFTAQTWVPAANCWSGISAQGDCPKTEAMQPAQYVRRRGVLILPEFAEKLDLRALRRKY